MTRHVADKRTPSEGGRIRNFVEVERQSQGEGNHPAAQALHQRGQERSDAARVKEFLRIDRGRQA